MLAVLIQELRSKELFLGNTVISLAFLWARLRQILSGGEKAFYLQLSFYRLPVLCGMIRLMNRQ